MEGLKLLGAEEDAVVIEIGRLYTKVGIGKESLPRCIVRNPDNLIALGYNSTFEEYFEVLRSFLNLIYYHKAQVNPKDSIVVISESLMAPRAKTEAIVKILFDDLQVPAVCLVLEESLALYTTGLYTGIMVDAGYENIRILPIFEGIPIVLAYQELDIGGKRLMLELKESLKKTNPGNFELETLEDISARLFMVTYGQLRKELGNEQIDKKTYSFYPLKHNSKVTITLRQRFLPDKVFFGSYAADENNIATGILKALLKCDIDTRKSLIGKIIVSGGCSMIPGFIERLEEEILDVIEEPEFSKLVNMKQHMRVKESVFPRNILNWVGGSIVSTLQGVEKFAILADKYKEKGLADIFGTYYLYANRPAMSEIYKSSSNEKRRISLINP